MPARAAVLLLVVGSVLVVAAPTEASLPELFALVAPGGWVSTYATPALAVERGGQLTLVNGDLMRHDLVATDYGSDSQPWCSLTHHVGHCPVFWSPLVGTGETTPVLGLENLVPGTVYPFFCTLHLGMRGELVALPPL